VIGHRGAAAAAPENTLASLEAAVAAGADVVEFDVAPGLWLAHSPRESPDERLALDDALEFLREQPIGLHLDVKEQGYEAEVAAAVRRHGVEGRAVISTAWPATARAFARLAPELPRAIGYPRDRYGVSRFAWPRPLTAAGAAALRSVMPVRVPLLLRWARANVLSLHHTLCSRPAVAAAHRLGAPVLAWTANDEATMRRLADAGVDAIVSDDPALARAVFER
jgi:glycerophosphoryl diester phosphodiesterase